MNKYNIYKLETSKIISFLGNFRKNFLLKHNINQFEDYEIYNKLYNIHNLDNDVFNIFWLSDKDVKETDKFNDIYEKDALHYFNLINHGNYSEKQKNFLKLDFFSYMNKKLNYIKSVGPAKSRIKTFYLITREDFSINFSNKTDLSSIQKITTNDLEYKKNNSLNTAYFFDVDKRLEFLENNLNNFNYQNINWDDMENFFNIEKKTISNSKKIILEKDYNYVLNNFILEDILKDEKEETINEILTLFIPKIKDIDKNSSNYQYIFNYILKYFNSIDKKIYYNLNKILKKEDLIQLYKIDKEIIKTIDSKDFFVDLIIKNDFESENEKHNIILNYLNRNTSYCNEDFILKNCIVENDLILLKIFSKQTIYTKLITEEQIEIIKNTIIQSKNIKNYLNDTFLNFLFSIGLSEKEILQNLDLNEIVEKNSFDSKIKNYIYKKEYFNLLNDKNKIKFLSTIRIQNLSGINDKRDFFERIINTNDENLISSLINNNNISYILQNNDLENINIFKTISNSVKNILENRILITQYLIKKDINLILDDFPLLFNIIPIGKLNSLDTKKYFINYINYISNENKNNQYSSLKTENFFLINQPDVLKQIFTNIHDNNFEFFIHIIKNKDFDLKIFKTIEFLEILFDISKKISSHNFSSFISYLPQQQKDFFNKISLDEISYSLYLEKLLLNLSIEKNINKTNLPKKNKI